MRHHNDKKYWKNMSRFYTVFARSHSALYRSICGRIAPYLKREMNVLEVACGTGQLSFPLSCRVRLWEATDFSELMIERAKKQASSSRLHFTVQDATSLPYAPQTFDAAVISNALHIMPHPEKVLSEIHRVLKPGGLLFAPTFLHGGKTRSRFGMHLVNMTGFQPYHKWDEQEFIRFLSEHGFAVTEHAVLGGGPAPVCFAAAEKKPVHPSN